jgi:hypothetical protein
MSQAQVPVVSLRTAAVWGTTVLVANNLTPGRSLKIGDGEGAVLAKPDNAAVSDFPIRAVGTGWELDARGATGGEVHLRGRREDPADLGRVGAPIPIVAGDYGLIQYGNFGIFFQFSNAVPPLAKKRRLDFSLLFSFLFASVAVLGALALFWATQTPERIPKPLELTDQAELMLQFNLKEEPTPPAPPQAGKAEDDKGSGVKDPGAKDPKPQGGGKKIRGDEGKLGKNGEAKETRQTGDIKAGLGGMAEALSSDVGDEVKKRRSQKDARHDQLGRGCARRSALERHRARRRERHRPARQWHGRRRHRRGRRPLRLGHARYGLGPRTGRRVRERLGRSRWSRLGRQWPRRLGRRRWQRQRDWHRRR